MSEQNINRLIARFSSIGFGASVGGWVEAALRVSVCFQKERFEIRDVLNRDGDTCVVTVLCAMEKSKNAFDAIYYDVVLRKAMIVEDIIINGVSVAKLNAAMNEINWLSAYRGKLIAVSDTLLSVEQTKEVEMILQQLIKLSGTSEGERFANQLRFHHWVDTPLEQIVTNFSALRWQFEISQRFYFFEEEQPISIDEAYRFLKSRWIEKQFHIKKKLVEQLTVDRVNEEKTRGKLITRGSKGGKAWRKPLLGKQ